MLGFTAKYSLSSPGFGFGKFFVSYLPAGNMMIKI
jgi:hypothetical protein